MSYGAAPVLPIFDYNETLLSPKDLERHVSWRVRIFLFASAWGSMAWFIGAPLFESLRLQYGVVLLVFQIWWLYIMLWVCGWAYYGMQLCNAEFSDSIEKLRNDKHAHTLLENGYTVPDLIHWIIVPNYKEGVEMLRGTLQSLALQSIGPQRICVLMACEGAEPGAVEKLMPLAAEFPEFRKFVFNVHRLRPGEIAGKSANVSAAFRSLCSAVYHATKDERLARTAEALALDFAEWRESPDARGNSSTAYTHVIDRGIITVIDADSILHPFHLYGIEKSYHFERHSTHNQCIWQAPIANMINMYSVPAASRLTSIIVSLHELASLVHPTQQKLPFSTYSLTTKLALDMGGWASDVLAEDWHCYARAFFAKRGECEVVPVHYPVLCYAVEETSYCASLNARFVQARRHAWGVIEVACLYAFWRDTPHYNRPSLYAFVALLWKMFKLHFITIFQTPMVIGAAIYNQQLAQLGYTLTEARTGDPIWWIFALTSALMAVLPLLTVFSFLLAICYERLLRVQRQQAHVYVSTPRHHNVDQITMPSSSLLRRGMLFVEFLLVMPLTSLFYGFLPSLISQTVLLFRKHYTYVVAAKPVFSHKK
jgi:hypothetical protein